MLENYLKITFRNIFKNKVYSLINISGLAIGITCCLLTILYIQDERSYDKHHPEAYSIYRVATVLKMGGDPSRMATSPGPLAFTLKQEYPEIEQVTRLVGSPDQQKQVVVYNNNTYFETDGYLADSTFFSIFAYTFLQGKANSALQEPNTVVLSETMAQQMFGSENPLHKIITINEQDYKVTGVFAQPETKSHINARYFTSIYSSGLGEYINATRDFVGGNFIYTYLKLRPDASSKALEAKFPAFLEKYAGEKMKAAGVSKSHFLQSVPDLHLYSSLEHESGANGGIVYIYILSSIAAFVLLIACINFMNLSTARSGKRAKEVGMRKILGAYRSTLIKQFLGESLILSCFAIVIACGLTLLCLPVFNQLTSKELSIASDLHFSTIAAIIGITLFTGLLAGSYPAFYLSGFQPIKVLKGLMVNHFAANFLRKGLVVFQFVVSVCLIVGTITMLSQLEFIQNKNLGFSKEQRIIIPLRTKQAREVYGRFRNEISSDAGVVSVAATSSYPGKFYAYDNNFIPEGKREDEATNCKINVVEPGLVETMGYQVIAGRSFSKARYAADKYKSVMINEAAARQMGWQPSEAIGKHLKSGWDGKDWNMEVTGVIKDFNYESLYEPIRPMAFMLEEPGWFGYAVVNAKTENWQNLLASVEQSWKKHNQSLPFEYAFLQDQLNQQYEADNRFFTTITYLTAIAIFISCLGLYGLATFTAEQRTKEIGVRKVLGASVGNITLLLSKDFLKLVILGILIASPLAWVGVNTWLQDFEYRVDVNITLFMMAGLAAILVALFTISFQSIKAALANPIKSLRNE
ncbi:FtsX-like permease family protein [Rhodocytophaga rosea]|uniref:FtsX-like permease family protein n=1 Tax=Rhodocytophaga rosea TaxID=2704465 RepID=A0A6C0GRD5_9BACT|nr:ABC transporter permease [Rhodocytophaga rosea]QHT70434.1 FtsX-like permease family protein [Rhodocytophaga rosea]